MDHDSKQCGSLPPLLRGSPALTDVRSTDVRAASSTALAPDRRLLMRVVRGNDSSAENPAEHGLASTGPKRKNRSNQSGRRRRRAETALAARENCRKKRKIPAPRLAGQGFFEACQSAEEPRRSSAEPPGARDWQRRKLERLCRWRGVALELGRNLPLRWPLHRGPLDRRSSHRGGRNRNRWSGSRRRVGTRPGSDLARLRNAPGRRSGGSLTSSRDRGRRRGRGGLGPFGASGKPTDGQGRRDRRTPQTTHVHRTRSSISRCDG